MVLNYFPIHILVGRGCFGFKLVSEFTHMMNPPATTVPLKAGGDDDEVWAETSSQALERHLVETSSHLSLRLIGSRAPYELTPRYEL